MSEPTWGELWRRVAWLAYLRARAVRRAWRHWRVSRRAKHRLVLGREVIDLRPGYPLTYSQIQRMTLEQYRAAFFGPPSAVVRPHDHE